MHYRSKIILLRTPGHAVGIRIRTVCETHCSHLPKRSFEDNYTVFFVIQSNWSCVMSNAHCIQYYVLSLYVFLAANFLRIDKNPN